MGKSLLRKILRLRRTQLVLDVCRPVRLKIKVPIHDPVQRTDSLEKTLMLGNTEGRKRRGQQRTRWLGNITESMDMNMGKLQDTVEDRTPGFCKESDNLATEQQSLCFQTMCSAL